MGDCFWQMKDQKMYETSRDFCSKILALNFPQCNAAKILGHKNVATKFEPLATCSDLDTGLCFVMKSIKSQNKTVNQGMAEILLHALFSADKKTFVNVNKRDRIKTVQFIHILILYQKTKKKGEK